MVAVGSTTFSFCSLAVTLTLSRPVTATIENSAPCGFQHLVQPHTWLCADWPVIETVTLLSAHLQDSVPPAKLGAAGLMPLSTAGWMEVAISMTSLVSCASLAAAPCGAVCNRPV